ncbi:MAG: hypothetical protein QF805_03035 [Pirellulaceae bacterium]|jgi:multisubunit Na+/H+ antiporter MnhE subunit|nr:hypothetical protein [Pirellulaceae bacterium]
MNAFVEIALTRTWWSYQGDDLYGSVYHWFNLFEGLAWATFAVLVARRHLRHRSSNLEWGYAAAFAAFAATDFCEAWLLTSWLIWLKLINLVVLLWVRKVVVSRYYPTAKLY